MDTIGARIRHARRAAKLPQTKIAKEIGVDQTTISKWERDVGPALRADEVLKLAELLGCEPMWLLSGAGRVPKNTDANLDATGTAG